MSIHEVKEFYKQDIVHRFGNQEIILGLVDDSYDDPETDIDDELEKGKIRIRWLNSNKLEVWNQNEVSLRSRNFLPGDIDNAVGRIVHFEQKITLVSNCRSIVEILDSIDNKIIEYNNDSHIITSFHLGQRVMAVPSSFEQPNWIKKSKTIMEKFNTLLHFTIQKIDYTNIQVSWQAYKTLGAICYHDTIEDEDIPRLKLLETMGNRILEIPTYRFLKIQSSDIQIRKNDWIRKQIALYCSKNQEVYQSVETINQRTNKRNKLDLNSGGIEGKPEIEDDESSIEVTKKNIRNKYKRRRAKQFRPEIDQRLLVGVLCTDAKVTIVWQDGTVENDVPTTELYYSTSLDEHEFFPGVWVIHNLESEKYGIVQKVDYFERTAFIKWFTYSEEEQKPIFHCMNEVSVYDIIKHPKFTFRPDTLVYTNPLEEERLGTVIDSLPEGCVLVKWLSGLEEKCWPQNIEVLGFEEPNNDIFRLYMPWEIDGLDLFSGPASYEPILEDMLAKCNSLKEKIVSLKERFSEQTNFENFRIFFEIMNDELFYKLQSPDFRQIWQVFIDKVEQQIMQIGVLPSINYQPNEVASSEIKDINDVDMQIENKLEQTPLIPDYITKSFVWIELIEKDLGQIHLTISEHIEAIQKSSVTSKALEEVANPTSSFPLTDSFTDTLTATLPKPTYVKPTENEINITLDEAPLYHHFYNSKIEPTNKQNFFKRLQKEYKLLHECLPPGVWVRTYSNRLDLLSIMIRGSNNGPYEDGLFLFDIQLSADYPTSPPLVHYISYSMEPLNPNLYVTGRVCVSLLGTWLGDSTEVWGPNSTLLQLIVSIQGLILVDEPYYNEAGYEKQRKSQQGYENSRTYNEHVLLNLVQSLSEMLLNAPDIFKKEILQHFSENGEKMCTRLKTFLNDEELPQPDFPLLPVSKGFKFSLNKALEFFMQTLEKVTAANTLTYDI